jgi:hypothetical protein
MTFNNIMRTKIFILSIIGLLFSAPLFADSGINDSGCGVTNYSGGSGMLYDMAVTIGGMMLFTLELCNAIAALLAIYSATIVYLKMIHGEEGVLKSIIMLIGACIFMIAATIIMPSFFGWQYTGI